MYPYLVLVSGGKKILVSMRWVYEIFITRFSFGENVACRYLPSHIFSSYQLPAYTVLPSMCNNLIRVMPR